MDKTAQPPTLTALEVSHLFYAVGMGWVTPKVIGETWADVYAGNVEFNVAGWKVVIFNDCDSWDYVDRVESPDGRFGGFHDGFHGWLSQESPFGTPVDLPVYPEGILGFVNVGVLRKMEAAFEGATQ